MTVAPPPLTAMTAAPVKAPEWVPTLLSAPLPAHRPEGAPGYLIGAAPSPAASPATGHDDLAERREPAWRRSVRTSVRLSLVAATLIVALVIPFSEPAQHGDDRAAWPQHSIYATSAAPTTQSLLAGTGVRLAAATVTTTTPSTTKVVASYGGGPLTAIPAPVLAAYQSAATQSNAADPSCHLSWGVLAGIGEIESRHAISGGSMRAGWQGEASPRILGPVLDGSPGRALIADTDNGKLDGNDHYDRAVGPMQFLPGTWSSYATDGNGDGVADPQNIYDATATAGKYLCDGAVDLSNPIDLAQAIESYNHADWYVRGVMAASYGYLAASYGHSQQAIADAAIAFALSHLGDPYEFGGNGPLYDCSGLTQAAYSSAGLSLARTSEQQWQTLAHVDAGALEPGDLVFFNPGEFVPGLPGHVGIYLGDGYMIDDPHTGAFVRIEPVAGFGTIVGAARPSLSAPANLPAPGSNFVITVVAPSSDGSATLVPATPSNDGPDLTSASGPTPAPAASAALVPGVAPVLTPPTVPARATQSAPGTLTATSAKATGRSTGESLTAGPASTTTAPNLTPVTASNPPVTTPTLSAPSTTSPSTTASPSGSPSDALVAP